MSGFTGRVWPSKPSEALSDYLPAFSAERCDEPFLTFYSIAPDKSLQTKTLSRGVFWDLSVKAAGVLRDYGLVAGDTCVHYFSDNAVEDLAFRLGATMLGTVPVTVNWQADTPERVVYKITLAKAKLLLYDAGVPVDVLGKCTAEAPAVKHFASSALEGYSAPPLPEGAFAGGLTRVDTRIVIFTSGTTGNPKGVNLAYSAYCCNRLTFEQFLQVEEHPATRFCPVVTNPFHHTNTTAVTDWALRRPGSHLHLLQRYTTQ